MAAFGAVEWLVSDRGLHFTSAVIKQLTDEARISHRLSTAYCSWANDTVECLCKEVLHTSHDLMAEWLFRAEN